MKAWLLSIVSIILLVILLEIILSEGSTKKFAQGAIRLAIVIVLIIPIISLINKFKNGNDTEILQKITDATQAQTNQLIYLSIYEEKIKNKLSGNGIKCDVKILYNNYEVSEIQINIQETCISDEEENINTNEKIIRIVNEILTIDRNKIIINASG